MPAGHLYAGGTASGWILAQPWPLLKRSMEWVKGDFRDTALMIYRQKC
jgi:hypothetical protein